MSTAVRVAVAQCLACLTTATAHIDADGQVAGVDVPFVRDRGCVFHKDCAGRFVAFDIDGGGLVDQ